MAQWQCRHFPRANASNVLCCGRESLKLLGVKSGCAAGFGDFVDLSFEHLPARISFTRWSPPHPSPLRAPVLNAAEGSQFNQSLDVYLKY